MEQDTFLFGMSATDLATLLAALASLAVMVAMWSALTVRDPMRGRVKALQDRREQLKAGIVASRRRASVATKAEATDFMRNILKKMSVMQNEQAKVASVKLMQAGIRSKDAVGVFLFGRLLLPIVLGIGSALAIYAFGMFPDYASSTKAMIVGGSLITGYKFPDIWVKNLVGKRSDAIRKGLPDALDLLVICAEAGLTVDAAFSRVSKELGNGYPELGDEFMLTSIELGFLTDRRQAFENLANRVDLEALRGVVTTMIQTERSLAACARRSAT